MNILVIGNGFDLAHGLPTTYSNFLGFIKVFKKHRVHFNANGCGYGQFYTEEKYNMIAESLHSQFVREHEKVCLELLKHILISESHYEEYVKLTFCIIGNSWIEYFLKTIEEDERLGKNWIDFENEIAQVINGYDEIRRTPSKHSSEFNTSERKASSMNRIVEGILKAIGNNADITAESIEEKMQHDLEKLISCLALYLERVVLINVENAKLIPVLEKVKIHKVLSFNYTSTYKHLYDISAKCEYDYLHGKINQDNPLESELVLGIVEFQEGEERDSDNRFITYKKFYQRILKRTGCRYKSWMHEGYLGEDCEVGDYSGVDHKKLFIFGHSLDVTDKDVLSELILNDNTDTTIYYHSEYALGEKIVNMVKVIGQDELISRVHGDNPTIVFKNQNDLEL